MDKPVRVRFAPSPTGYLHMGGARTTLFNWLFARKHGGKMVLRIEDTDQARSRPELVTAITESLSALGLDWDEGPEVGGPYGPYEQSKRRHLYQAAAQRLVAEGKAYRCYCTPEELTERREALRREGKPPRYDGRCRHLTAAEHERLETEGRAYVLRLRVPDDGVTVVHDLIKGDIAFDNQQLDDFIIVRSDGNPVYNFVVVVDDAAMEITHVIRADEHLSNTPKQIQLYQALGYPLPEFAHVPMILAPDRSKLSKRHGAVAVEEFLARGYLPEAIINYLALLGWSPGDDRELFFTRAELLEAFSLDRVNKTGAIYDVDKLTWMNSMHMRALAPERYLELAMPWLERAGLLKAPLAADQRRWLSQVLTLVRERVRTFDELPDAVNFFFVRPEAYDPKGVRKQFRPEAVELLREAAARLESLSSFTAATAEAAYRALAEERGVKPGALIHPTRLAVTGRTVGPGLFELLEVVGQQETVARLREAAAKIPALCAEEAEA